ncbi:MAG: hypothetical protein HKN00_13450 [Flavobacteriaceae bacterium]|nr:hypothetical protein [Bacteroidia bacterium]MBT8288808.1 hypothetical protein [Bacteroidia bacterium]NNF76184.1 hypothetical protein [Flavobacteriaceae bacterium]NNK72877.1 hypothetical protein [Flavobacteriaceae bacterium]
MNTVVGLISAILLIFQQSEIDEKLNNAPDNDYALGVLIGSLLPFVILVLAAYLIFRSHKNSKTDSKSDEVN